MLGRLPYVPGIIVAAQRCRRRSNLFFTRKQGCAQCTKAEERTRYAPLHYTHALATSTWVLIQRLIRKATQTETAYLLQILILLYADAASGAGVRRSGCTICSWRALPAATMGYLRGKAVSNTLREGFIGTYTCSFVSTRQWKTTGLLLSYSMNSFILAGRSAALSQ